MAKRRVNYDEEKFLGQVEEAKILIALYAPFWSNLLAHLPVKIEFYEDAYAATDGFHIFLSPVLAQFPTEIVAGVILHEVMHVAYRHFLRKHNRNLHLWNIATDIVVNNAIKDTGHFPLPSGVLWDPKMRGFSAEEVYDKLVKELARVKGGIGVEGESGEKKKKGTLSRVEKWKEGKPDKHLDPAMSWSERKKIEEDIENWLVESYNIWKNVSERRRGRIPGNLVEQIEILVKNEIPWKRILERYLNMIFVKDDYAPLPPSRKYLPYDLYFPSLKREVPEGVVVIALDTSGSMSAKDIGEALSELVSLKYYTEEIYLIMHDSKITDVLKTKDLVNFDVGKKVKVKGRGGTSHVPVFDYLDMVNLKPDLFIGFTDGYSVFPKNKPTFPVIWVLTRDHKKPPFGVCITTDFERKKQSLIDFEGYHII